MIHNVQVIRKYRSRLYFFGLYVKFWEPMKKSLLLVIS